MNKTFKCSKCKDGDECTLVVPDFVDTPLWCPFGLYPTEDNEQEMEANWVLEQIKKSRRSK